MATKNCNFKFEEIGYRGNKWITGCNKEILYVTALGEGVSQPPLPTDGGAKFCTFCGKPIRIPKKPEPRKAPDPPTPPPYTPDPLPENRPERGPPMPRPLKPPAMPPPHKVVANNDPNHKTYDDWLLAGYQVRRGEKSTTRNRDGKAVFHRKQTDKALTVTRPPLPRGHHSDFDDDDIPF